MRSVRVVFYLRMSTDKQETSIADQRKELAAHAKARSYSVVGEYVDEGISGDATEKRLAFQRMVADSGKKRFELILCWDQDRFGRFDPLEGGYWIKPIRDAGVQLETIAQGRIDWSDFASRLVWTITQEAKHAYLRTMSRDVVRGLRSAVESGVYPGMAPFGYRKQNKRLVLGPAEEVEIVRDIFAMKISGMGHRTIMNRLHDAGRIAPGTGEWYQGQVRYILARKTYTGNTYYGKVRGGKYSSQDSMIVVQGTHPAIITEETFEAAKASCKPGTVSYRHGRMVGALAGLMKCGNCGAPMYRFKYKNDYGYICSRYHRKRGCGFCKVMEGEALEIIAVRIRKSVGENEASLAKRIARLHVTNPKAASLPAMQKRLTELDQQISRAAERIVEVDDDILPAIKRKIAELRTKRQDVAAEIEALAPDQNFDPLATARRLIELPEMMRRMPAERVREMLGKAVSSITVLFEQQKRNCTRRFFDLIDIEVSLRL